MHTQKSIHLNVFSVTSGKSLNLDAKRLLGSELKTVGILKFPISTL